MDIPLGGNEAKGRKIIVTIPDKRVWTGAFVGYLGTRPVVHRLCIPVATHKFFRPAPRKDLSVFLRVYFRERVTRM